MYTDKPFMQLNKLKQQLKPQLHQLDISMPDNTGVFGHRARAPNTDHAARRDAHHQAYEARQAEIEKQAKDTSVARTIQHDEFVSKRQLRNLIQKKLNEKIHNYVDRLEEKRNRLRNMLAEEEELYIRETVEMSQNANDSKITEMKERSQQLKERKEAERLEIVKQKRIQQYSMRLPELRTLFSKKQTVESKMCQLQQMRDNEARRQAENEMESMWNDLMQRQNEAIWERECYDAIVKYNKCKKDMDVLTMQVRAKKLEQEKHKELERINVLETKKIWEMQEQQIKEDNLRKLNKRKQDAEDLQKQVELQRQFMAQRKKEELALENAFARLTQLEIDRENAKIVDSKGRLQREIDTYKHHLEHMKEHRRQEIIELEELVSQVRKDEQQKQDAKSCAFQESRRKLKEKVLEERAAQVEYNRKKFQEHLEQQRHENEIMREIFERDNELYKQTEHIRHLAVLQYRNDLQKQLEYRVALKKEEMEEMEKRLKAGIAEEIRLENLVKEMMYTDVTMPIPHPFKKKLADLECMCEASNDDKK